MLLLVIAAYAAVETNLTFLSCDVPGERPRYYAFSDDGFWRYEVDEDKLRSVYPSMASVGLSPDTSVSATKLKTSLDWPETDNYLARTDYTEIDRQTGELLIFEAADGRDPERTIRGLCKRIDKPIVAVKF